MEERASANPGTSCIITDGFEKLDDEIRRLPPSGLPPISLDFTLLQDTIDASLIAERRKMDGGVSPRELYVKSNPNLLMNDVTNPRIWYDTDVQKSLLKSLKNADHYRNNHGDENQKGPGRNTGILNVEIHTSNKLPHIRNRERKYGTKSAEYRGNKHYQHNTSSLIRGPSFEEATARYVQRRAVPRSVPSGQKCFAKSLSWSGGRDNNKAARKVSLNSRDPKISLPPLNPERGHPFLPHLPTHRPWLSAKSDDHQKYQSNCKTQGGHQKESKKKEQNVKFDFNEESELEDKIQDWFANMNDQPRYFIENDDGIKFGAERLPEHHLYKGQITDVLRDRDKVIVPYPKHPIQYDAVYNELRIERNVRNDEKTEINRKDYKLKQKSSLQLKCVESFSETNNRIQPHRVTLDLDEKSSKGESLSVVNSKATVKKFIPVSDTKRPIKADRKTGKTFILTKATENEEYSDSDEGIEDEINEDCSEMPQLVERTENLSNGPKPLRSEEPCHGDLPIGLFPETKTTVVNLVLTNERPPNRNPHHIVRLSQVKCHAEDDISSPSQESGKDKTLRNCDESLTYDIKGDLNDNVTEGIVNGDKAHFSSDVEESKTEKIDASFFNGKPAVTSLNAPTEQLGSIDHVNENCASNDNNNISNRPKLDRAALSKYNILGPFRDGSQPNIVLPRTVLAKKPTCNQWTRPPAYKLDLNNRHNNHQQKYNKNS